MKGVWDLGLDIVFLYESLTSLVLCKGTMRGSWFMYVGDGFREFYVVIAEFYVVNAQNFA